MEINYKKNNNKQLFENFNNNELLDIESSQNYFPLYNNFFNLNNTNYNAINLNNKYSLELILEKINYNKFLATITDICNNKSKKANLFCIISAVGYWLITRFGLMTRFA